MDLRLHQTLTFRLLCTAFLLSWGLSGCRNQASSSRLSAPEVAGAAAVPAAFDRQILRDFAAQVVVPNNRYFAQRASNLSKSIDAFTAAPSAQTLAGAQGAWVEARAAWEQTECFGFGPTTSLGYDGALDTWPVNETDFKALLKSGEPLTAGSVSKMKDTEKGFHVIEYFLFGQGKSRKPGDLAPRDLKYLQLLGADFAKVAADLTASWSKGVEGNPAAYQQVFATAGDSGNATYPTVQAGAQEMIQGMLDSLDEVANEKLSKPLKEKNPKLAESRFSLNTLTDMQSNLQGAQNVYLGSFPDAKTSGKGLSAHVAQVNPVLDDAVKQKFKAAAESLRKIPAPFETAILDPKAVDSIEAAQAAINAVHKAIEQDVKPLVVKS
jgi:putative iron-regulated protein